MSELSESNSNTLGMLSAGQAVQVSMDGALFAQCGSAEAKPRILYMLGDC